MSCPFYIDFTRDCIKAYPTILQYKDFTNCESEGYQKCIIYRILQSDFRCEYLSTCLNMFPEEIPEFYHLLNTDPAIYEYVTKPLFQYCLSKDNHVRCARFQMRHEGKEPAPGLTPYGKNVDINDSIFKHKIIFEKPS